MIIVWLKDNRVVPKLYHGHALWYQTYIYKLDFQLPRNLTDDSIILDNVKLPVKNHWFLDVSSDDLYWVGGDKHPNIEFTYQIKVCYNLKANKADCFVCLFVCLFVWFFTFQSTFFQLCRDRSSYVEAVLNKDKCVLLKDTTQWRRWGSNPRSLVLESSTLPLSHCAPKNILYWTLKKNIYLWIFRNI